MTTTPHPFRTGVAAEVRAELARQGKKPADLEQILGKSRPTIALRFNGSVAWDADELGRIADALGVPPETFIPRGAA